MSKEKSQPISSANASPKSLSVNSPNANSPSANSGYNSYAAENGEINVREINRCLSKMDVEEVRRRRLEYNLYFKVKLIAYSLPLNLHSYLITLFYLGNSES